MTLGLIFSVVGLGLLVFGLFQKKKLQAMTSWPQVSGSICSTGIDESTSTDSDGDVTVTFKPLVRYDYVVAGTAYQGHRIALMAQSYNNPGRAEFELSAYPVGKQVPVYYNPAKPSDCVLVRRAPGSNLLLILGGIFLAIGIAVIVRSMPR